MPIVKDNILIVDDYPANLKILETILRKQGYHVQIINNGPEAIEAINKTHPDLVLLDIMMPVMDGFEVCKRIKANDLTKDIPIIFITAIEGLESKIKGFSCGCVDFITKPFQSEEVIVRVKTHLEIRHLQTILNEQNEILKAEILTRKKTEKKLRISEERFRTIFETAHDGIFMKNSELKYTLSNPSMERIFSLPSSFFLGKTDMEIVEDEVAAKLLDADNCVLKGEIIDEEYSIHAGGAPVILHIIKVPMYNDEHDVSGICGIARDISKQRRMESRMRLFDKMETIGVLAGGIAHDINNIMAIISGNITLAKDDTDPRLDTYEYLDAADKAILQAIKLTRQFTTLSKSAAPVLCSGNPGLILKEMANQSLERKGILITTTLSDNLWNVKFDREQLHDALSKIITNACEAMPHGGKITMKTENFLNDYQLDTINITIPTGRYIKISITDTGIGISEKNLPHIFDPYFSTKERGKQKGMGLGLSITFAIIKKHKGYISVESKIEEGTTFTIYLPAC